MCRAVIPTERQRLRDLGTKARVTPARDPSGRYRSPRDDPFSSAVGVPKARDDSDWHLVAPVDAIGTLNLSRAERPDALSASRPAEKFNQEPRHVSPRFRTAQVPRAHPD